MRAVVVEQPGRIVVKKVDDPKVTENDVLVRIITSSICNVTDAHIANGTFEGYHDFYPQILGHEVYGEIVEVGKEVRSCRRGDRVVLYSESGAFCEYIAFSPDRKSTWARILPGIPEQAASLCEMLHGAYISMVYPAGVRDTDDVMLVGQGPMGLTATQLAALRARSVTVVDLFRNRLDKAREVGADFAYNRSEMSAEEIVSSVEETTKGVDLVFMCIDMDLSKNTDAFDMAVEALRPNGRMSGLKVAVKGLNHRVNPRLILEKNIRFQHKFTGQALTREQTLEVFAQGVRFVADGKVNLETLITHETGFDGVEDALEMCMNSPGEVIKVVVRP